MSTSTASTSRRALLTAAIGGIAAGAASALGRTSPVAANHDSAHVNAGTTTITYSPTIVSQQGNFQSGDGIVGEVGNTGGNGVKGVSGMYTTSGVYGENTLGGYGVAGRSNGSWPGYNGIGVYGEANRAGGLGVWGSSTNGTAVKGISANGDGVQGESTNANGVIGQGQAKAMSGVYGANYAAGGYGVAGYGPSIRGVGVRGFTEYGTGIHAYAWAGLALLAEAGHASSTALRVQAGPCSARRASPTSRSATAPRT